MAFFDNLGKKLTSVSQTAVQKTKDVADIAKINSEISELERTVNNLYYQIGKLYVAKHAADCENDFSGMISSLLEAENRITERRQKIQDIKGVVRCEKCGAEVSAIAAFCSACGAAMPKNQAANINQNLEKCPSCGAMVPKGNRFCTACGKPMLRQTVPEQQQAPDAGSPAAPAQQTASAASEQPPAQGAQTQKICPACGAVNEPDCAFCTECGYKL